MSDENAADDEWRFPLSDFEEDGEAGDDGGPAAADAEATEAATGSAGDRSGAGDVDADETIRPGDPTLEGAVFFLLGVAFALFVISRPLVG